MLEIGDGRKEDHAFFKALDEEMQSGGLAAMLYDLQRHEFSSVNVRKAPVTKWLVDQRLHSQDSKKRWWRDVLADGGFRLDENDEIVQLSNIGPTCVSKEVVFSSARPHFGPERRKASKSEVGTFLKKMLSKLPDFGGGPRLREGEERSRTYIFPALPEMRKVWEATTGEDIAGEEKTSLVAAELPTCKPLRDDDEDEGAKNRLTAALLSQGIKDPQQIRAAIDAVLASRKSAKRFSVVPKSLKGQADKAA